MENDCDEMMELDFRRWIMKNFCELKKHVLNQRKETKNDNKNGYLREKYEWIKGAEKHNMRTSQSMHKFQ